MTKTEPVKNLLQLALLFAIFAAAYALQASFFHMPVRSNENLGAAVTAIADLQRVDGVPEPAVTADSVIVARINTGQVLFVKDPFATFPIGSLTKLLTAVVVSDTLDPLEQVMISPDSKIPEEEGEKMSAIPAGESFRVEDLLKLMLVDSASDAARSLAEAAALKKYPGATAEEQKTAFAFMLNDRARSIGMASSSFANATGIDNPDSFSTAYDVFMLARYITATHPSVWAMTRTVEGQIFSREGNGYTFMNTNPLLREMPMIYGSKTGTTDEAGEALLMLYQVAFQDPVAIVILRSHDRLTDARELVRFIETGFLLK